MRKKKIMPLALMILLDIVVFAAALNGYALVHHVLNFKPKAAAAYSNIPTEITQTASGKEPETASGTIAQEIASEPMSSEGTSMTEVTPEPTPEPTPEVDYGQFGEKFKDKFTSGGEVIVTENLYVSENIRVELTEDFDYGSKIHIVDIYVKNITNFRTAFASGEAVFDGQRAKVIDQAEKYNAVAAINGDFCGFSEWGEYSILRNGVFFQNNPTRAVCVLYYDGTMKCFWEKFNQTGSEFNIDQALEDGAWQIWSFGPSLLDENGVPNEGVNYDVYVKNPRTMLGYYEPGHYCFVTIEGRTNTSTGVNFGEEAAYAQKLGLKQAFNLDGGGSSTLVFNHNLISIGSPTDPNRPVTDIVYILDGEVSLVREDLE